MNTFAIKQDDLLPEPQVTLYDALGAVVDLTTAVSVQFLMRNADTLAVKVNAAATVVTPTAGVVKYVWAGTDTDTAGSYQAEWEVTWSGSRKQTFPTKGFDTVVVYEDVG